LQAAPQNRASLRLGTKSSLQPAQTCRRSRRRRARHWRFAQRLEQTIVRPRGGAIAWPQPRQATVAASNAIRRRLALRLAGMAKAAYRTGATCVKRAWRGGFGQKRLSAGGFLAIGTERMARANAAIRQGLCGSIAGPPISPPATPTPTALTPPVPSLPTPSLGVSAYPHRLP
jgi:hypothetical protein